MKHPNKESDSHHDHHPAQPPTPLMNGNGSGLTVLPLFRDYRNSTLFTFSEIRSRKKWRWQRISERVTRSWRHPKVEKKHVGTLGLTRLSSRLYNIQSKPFFFGLRLRLFCSVFCLSSVSQSLVYNHAQLISHVRRSGNQEATE